MISNKLFLPEKFKTAKPNVSRFIKKNKTQPITKEENKTFDKSIIIYLSNL